MEQTNVSNSQTVDWGKWSKEQIIEFLEGRNLVKEFAAEADILKEVKDAEEETKKSKKRSETTWELTMNNYPDFVIRKITGRSWKMLVVMVSKGVGYLKDSKGSKKLTVDDVDLLAGFLRGMPKIEIPNSWIDYLGSGIVEAKSLLYILIHPDIMEGYKNHCGPQYKRNVECIKAEKVYNNWQTAYSMHANLMKKYSTNRKALDLIISSPNFVKDIKERWGIDNVYDYLDHFTLSLVQLSKNRYGWNSEKYESLDVYDYYGRTKESLIPKCDMQYTRFRDYALYDAYRLGYGDNINSFFNVWDDTLNMEKLIYDKIKDKYPENLQTLHDILAYKAKLLKQEIDKKKFQAQVEKACQYEDAVGDYVFIAPKVVQDFYDEAEMQQNCLASYVDRFTNGECIIMFMRMKNTPEESLVTIEVRSGKVIQQYQSRNRLTTEEQKAAIEQWIKNLNKKGVIKLNLSNESRQF